MYKKAINAMSIATLVATIATLLANIVIVCLEGWNDTYSFSLLWSAFTEVIFAALLLSVWKTYDRICDERDALRKERDELRVRLDECAKKAAILDYAVAYAETAEEETETQIISGDVLLNAVDYIGNDPEKFGAINDDLDMMRKNKDFRKCLNEAIDDDRKYESTDFLGLTQEQCAEYVWAIYSYWHS